MDKVKTSFCISIDLELAKALKYVFYKSDTGQIDIIKLNEFKV